MASNHIHESPTAEVDPFESIESLLLNVEEKTLEKGLKEREDISFLCSTAEVDQFESI